MRRFISILLIVCMAFVMMPALNQTAWAETVNSGACGDNLSWTVDENGNLTISGTGPMWDYKFSDNPAPWYKLGIKSVTMDPGVTSIGDYAFYGCKDITEFIIPENVTTIGEDSFASCKMKEFTIPDSVTEVGSYAFNACVDLETIKIGKNATGVEDAVFHCYGLTEFQVSDECINYSVKDGVLFSKDGETLLDFPCNKTGSYTVPEGTKVIGYTAFMNSKLTELIISEGVTSLEPHSVCDMLNVSKVTLPTTLTEIGSYSFSESRITSISIPDSVTTLGNSCFSNCVMLTDVTVGSGIETINESVFSNCNKLKNITLSEGLKSIGKSAFMSCERLVELTIPSTVTSIGDYAFSGCRSLKTVLFKGSAPEIGDNAFDSIKTASYYNSEDITWYENTGTELDVRQDYGGRVCWAGVMANPDIPRRMAGSTRQGTAVAISQAGFDEKTENVIIASGDDYPDALAGGPLAYMLNAPILLVRRSRLDQETLNEIRRLGAKNAYILGGTGVVDDNVSNVLKSRGLKVERISGATRFETATAVAKKMDELRGGKPTAAFFVYSHNYPDALSISNVAAIAGVPILYIENSGVLRDSTKKYMDSIGQIGGSIIIGGPALIGSNAEEALNPYGEVSRLYGSDRYETCIMINLAFRDVLNGDSICLACGTNYPDALSGSVTAAFLHAPMLLVKGNNLTQLQQEYVFWKAPVNVFAFGGTGVLSDAVENDVNRLSLFGTARQMSQIQNSEFNGLSSLEDGNMLDTILDNNINSNF